MAAKKSSLFVFVFLSFFASTTQPSRSPSPFTTLLPNEQGEVLINVRVAGRTMRRDVKLIVNACWVFCLQKWRENGPKRKKKSDEQRGKIPARQGTSLHHTHWFVFSFLSLRIRACHAKKQLPGVVTSSNSSLLLTYSNFLIVPPRVGGTFRRWQISEGYSYPYATSCSVWLKVLTI